MTALLALMVALLPWFQGGGSADGLALAHTLILIACGAALVLAVRSGRLALTSGWEAVWGLGLVALAVASFLTVDYPYGSFLSLWNAAISLLLALALLSGVRMDRTVIGLVLSATAGAMALHVLIAAAPANMTPSGTFSNANHLTAWLTLGVLVSAGLCADARRAGGGAPFPVQASRLVAIMTGLAATLGVTAMLRAGSRAALLSLIIAAILWAVAAGWLHGGRSGRARLIATALLMLALAGGAVAWRFNRIDDPYRFDRPRIWLAGLRAAVDHPALGLGPGMFERRGYRYNFPLDREVFRYAKMPGSTHSTWVQSAAELGFPGLVMAAALAIVLARSAWRVARRASGLDRACALAILALLIQACFDTPFDVPAVTLTLMTLVAPLLRPPIPEAAVAWSGDTPMSRAGVRAAMAVCLLLLAFAEGGLVLRPWAAHRLYVAALDRGSGGASGAALDRAIRLDPLNPLYPATRGEWIAGRPAPLDPAALAAAHRDLETARALDPGNPSHLLALAHLHARACAESGCDEAGARRAEGYYEAAIALGRKDPRPLVELAAMRASLGRGAEAIPLLEEAVALEPRFPEAWLGLARLKLQRGDSGGAAAALRELDEALAALRGHVPRNRYEQDLMRLDLRRVEEIRAALRLG